MAKQYTNTKIKGTKCWRKRETVKNDRGRTIYQEFRNGGDRVSVVTLMPKLHSVNIDSNNRIISGKAHKSVKSAIREATKYMKKHDRC